MTSAFDDQAVPMMTSAHNVGVGWHPLIRELEEVLNRMDPNFTLQQVKEKFGGLRYYAQTTNQQIFDRFHSAIMTAEEKSFHICEECGEPGTTMSFRGWLKTLCHPGWNGTPGSSGTWKNYTQITEEKADGHVQDQEGPPDGNPGEEPGRPPGGVPGRAGQVP